MARKVPEGANRGPRDRQVAIYLSEEEVEALDKYAKNLGFRSKTALIVYVMEDLIHDGFSPICFSKLAIKFTNLIDKSGKSEWAWNQLNPFRKRAKKAMPQEFEEK